MGKTLADLGFQGWIEVTGVRRRGSPSRRPDAGFRFEAGDVVVLLGRPKEIALAEARLLEG